MVRTEKKSDYIDLNEVVDDFADLALILWEKDHVEEAMQFFPLT